jgi:hypothetical protein
MLAPGVRHIHGTVFTAEGGRALLALLSGVRKPLRRRLPHVVSNIR